MQIFLENDFYPRPKGAGFYAIKDKHFHGAEIFLVNKFHFLQNYEELFGMLFIAFGFIFIAVTCRLIQGTKVDSSLKYTQNYH